MNWPKIKTINLQPAVDWLFRQRTEVVLLCGILGACWYAIAWMVPSALDRQERLILQVEDRHVQAVKDIGRQYQMDQTRDAAERLKLIDKLTLEHAAQGWPIVVKP